jgi:predicted NAD/FAD-dependent oxidoreductase
VVVFDKGRGPGGRASSRRRQDFSFDHGAQYFTARDVRFLRQVNAWREDGVIARWTPRLAVIDADGVRVKRQDLDRYVGMPGMNAVAKHLASDLKVHSQVKVGQVEIGKAGWRIVNEDWEAIAETEAVIVTVPPTQAVPLLSGAPGLAEKVNRVIMRPCWAVLLGFAKPLLVDFDGAFVNVGPLAWVARNSSKPGRTGGEAWVLHASTAWSEQHLERDTTEIGELLHTEFANLCAGSELPTVLHTEVHRWRYAQPDPALETPCLWDQERKIGVAGDWCGGPKIEGAYLSGLAVADRILDWAGDRAGDGNEVGA